MQDEASPSDQDLGNLEAGNMVNGLHLFRAFLVLLTTQTTLHSSQSLSLSLTRGGGVWGKYAAGGGYCHRVPLLGMQQSLGGWSVPK